MLLGLLAVAAIAPFKAKADEVDERTELVARLEASVQQDESTRRLETQLRIEAAKREVEVEVVRSQAEHEEMLVSSSDS